jgi:DNA-binding transcriptional MerR regulator
MMGVAMELTVADDVDQDLEVELVAEVEYTIDELAAFTRVPSRTIRYYQSKGALPKPTIRGRVAIYSDAHVERLRLIAMLQDRGLQIKAIRDLVVRIDSGELVLEEWLGLEERIAARWGDDSPKLYSESELQALVGDGRVGVIADVVRLGLVERQGDAYLAKSPALLTAMLQMEQAGIDLQVACAGAELVRKHMAKLAYELAEHYARHTGDGFGRSAAPNDLSAAYDAARPLGQTVVHTVFGQEMEKALRTFVESGRAARVTRRKR